MKTIRSLSMAAAGLSLGLAAGPVLAQGTTPFKLGTFQQNGREFTGLVLNDTKVVDIAQANVAYQQRNAGAAAVTFPADMKQLIAGYDAGLGARLAQIAAAEVAAGAAPYVHRVDGVAILPPVRPAVILNGGANYPEHLAGIQARNAAVAGAGPGGASAAAAPPAPPASKSMPGIWTRPPGDVRPDNPYLFLKSPAVVVGANDDVVLPFGREQLDFECEFAVVIGKRSRRVPVANAADHIFGYTIEFDVSDRGGRNDRKMGGGPDWLVQKNHDTFGPIGPYIVPKAFMPKPMDTRHFFTLNGELMQDSNTSRMAHNIYELLSYASGVMTLNPGDIIAAGSPSGTNIERVEQRWMRAGDEGVCTIEGIGVQRHRIVAEK
ncbi:MAG: fumarylacetoacetate hydrolase family protein [Pseudomonadota bacterium]